MKTNASRWPAWLNRSVVAAAASLVVAWAVVAAQPRVHEVAPHVAAPSAAPLVHSAAPSPLRPPKWSLEPLRELRIERKDVSVSGEGGQLLAFYASRGPMILRDGRTPGIALDEVIDPARWRLRMHPLESGWYLADQPKMLGAFDAQSLELAWQLPLAPVWLLRSVTRAGNIAVVETDDAHKNTRSYYGVDIASSALVWQRQIANVSALSMAVAVDDVVCVLTASGRTQSLHAIEPQTGKERWREHASPRDLLAFGKNAVLVTIEKDSVLVEAREARTGKVVAQATLQGQYRQRPIIDGNVLFVMTSSLTALAADTLQVLWQKAIEADPSRYGGYLHLGYPFLAATEGAVVLCENSTLRAFEAHSGTQLWSYGLELSPCSTFAALPGPRVYWPRTSRWGEENELADDAIVEFAPSTKPAELATVRGKVSGLELPGHGLLSPTGARVLVDNTFVDVDEQGGYEARVSTRGIVRIDVQVPVPAAAKTEKCDPAAQGHQEIKLTGAGVYVADLQLGRYCR